MLVRILGPLEVSSDLGSPSLGGPKQRVVLACLALRIGRVTPVDELIEAGWGDDLPANPANALQYQIAQLRKVIESDAAHPQYLITSRPGYRLDPDTVTTDAEQFEASLAGARQAFDTGDIDRALNQWYTNCMNPWHQFAIGPQFIQHGLAHSGHDMHAGDNVRGMRIADINAIVW